MTSLQLCHAVESGILWSHPSLHAMSSHPYHVLALACPGRVTQVSPHPLTRSGRAVCMHAPNPPTTQWASGTLVVSSRSPGNEPSPMSYMLPPDMLRQGRMSDHCLPDRFRQACLRACAIAQKAASPSVAPPCFPGNGQPPIPYVAPCHIQAGPAMSLLPP